VARAAAPVQAAGPEQGGGETRGRNSAHQATVGGDQAAAQPGAMLALWFSSSSAGGGEERKKWSPQEAQPVFRKGGKFVGTQLKQFFLKYVLETSTSNDEAGVSCHTNQHKNNMANDTIEKSVPMAGGGGACVPFRNPVPVVRYKSPATLKPQRPRRCRLTRHGYFLETFATAIQNLQCQKLGLI
jgi:hypothetical protein